MSDIQKIFSIVLITNIAGQLTMGKKKYQEGQNMKTSLYHLHLQNNIKQISTEMKREV